MKRTWLTYSAVARSDRRAGVAGGQKPLPPYKCRSLPGLFARILLLSLAFAGLSGCSRVAPVVKVGLVAPFEGEHRAVGYDAIYAARLALREINAAGGIDGVRLELVALDDSGNRELARQSAASLVVDTKVVAVVGHWLAATTEVARPLYARGDLALLAAGAAPLRPYDPALLPTWFRDAYMAVAPFDEEPGPYAAPTYDAFMLLGDALKIAETEGEISRQSVAVALQGLQYQGLSGRIYRP
jgi:ABC-type branched-subunit amino acid transport system substrate-binding protein